MPRIPTSVTCDAYLEAIKPLLDLLGVTAENVHVPVVIDAEAITLSVPARRLDEDTEGRIQGIALADAPQDFAHLAYHVKVEIKAARS